MPERAYTLDEIDKMRQAIHQILFPMKWWSRTSGAIEVGNYPNRADRDNHVEMRLRTYMKAGIDPMSLFIEADLVKDRAEQQRLSYPEIRR